MPRAATPLTEEQRAAIVAARAAGKSIGAISRELDIHETRVYMVAEPAGYAKRLARARELRALRKTGQPVVASPSRVTERPADVAEVERMMGEGASGRLIAHALKVTRRQVENAKKVIEQRREEAAQLDALMDELFE